MADTFTSNILLTLMSNGSHNNTWNDIYGANDTAIDTKLGALTTFNTAGGTTTMISSEELVAKIRVTGALLSACTIAFSGRKGVWLFENASTGLFTVTAKVTGQTGVTIPRGEKCVLYCNGTDIEKIVLGTPKPPPIALTDGATVTIDARLGDTFTLTAAGNRLLTITNPTDNQRIVLFHKASGADRTLSPDVMIEFGTDIVSWTATVSTKTDLIGLIYNATLAKWLAAGSVKGFA